MDFEEWLGDRIETLSSHEYAAEKAAWEAAWGYQQERIDHLEAIIKANQIRPRGKSMLAHLPEGYVLVPVKPSPRMIIDMAWWCRELSLSTGDLVEFWESMVESAQELDDEY